MKEVTLRMTREQIKRYHVIMASLEGKMTVAEAATAMGISERQAIRLRKGVKEEGAAFLIHKNAARIPAHTITEGEKQEIVALYQQEKYRGANFLHYSELLDEHEGIRRSRSTIHRVLTGAGIVSPKKRRRFKPHHRRKRKAQEGTLIQMDASPYEWFGGRAKYTLHGAIDDATGKIVGAYMTKNECLHGYFETMRRIVEQNGVPVSVYVDMHTIFRSPKADKLTVEDQLAGKTVADTQFGRAMKELGVTLIYARSAQAKGRVERLWETLQSRLMIEFHIRNIKDEHEANAFLVEYIPKFNEQFAVEPEQTESAYIPLAQDLDHILCVREQRTVDNGGVFSFHGKLLKVIDESVPGKAKIDIIASATKGVVALYKGSELEVFPYVKPKKQTASKAVPRARTPSVDHPWSVGKPKIPLYSSDLVDSEIRKMLVDIFL